MIYDCKNTITEILSVDRMAWEGGIFNIPSRQFSALSFRINGSGTITANGEKYNISPNNVLYLPQNLSYQSEFSNNEILVIHFKTIKTDNCPEVYSFSNSELIYESFLRAHSIWQNKKPGYQARIMAELYSILGEICENETKEKAPEYFLNAVSFINSNYTDPNLSIEAICKSAGLGATNLRLLFKTFYQKTPIEYIASLKLEHARNLISCGIPIEVAAEKSGFSDPKYFARVVKKHFNCTPRELKLYSK